MKNKIILVFFLLIINTLHAKIDEQKLKQIVIDRKINSLLTNVENISAQTNIDLDNYGEHALLFKDFDEKKELDVMNGYVVPSTFKLEKDSQGSQVLQLGCDGITYNGALEQKAIGYMELLRDSFVEFTDPYICPTGKVPLLEKFAFTYAMSICSVELGSLLMNGTDTEGNEIAGESMTSLSESCAGRYAEGTGTTGATKANTGKLFSGGADAQIGLGGSFAYMKCLYEGVSKLGLSKYMDACISDNRNDFFNFVDEMSNLNFATNLSIEKLRVEECENILDGDGNSLNIKLGILDLFGSDKKDKAQGKKPPSYKNINGILLETRTKKVYLQDDTLHSEIRKKLGYPLTNPKEGKKIIKKMLLQEWENRTALLKKEVKKYSFKNGVNCIEETGEQFADLYATILSNYNLGINKYIYTLNDEIYFSRKYRNTFMTNKLPKICKVVQEKYKNSLIQTYESFRNDKIKKYFEVAYKILTDISSVTSDENNSRHELLSEKYFSNKTTGKLNLEIEKFNMDRMKNRSNYLLKSKILKFIYTQDKEK